MSDINKDTLFYQDYEGGLEHVKQKSDKKKQKLNAERIRNALYELRDAGLISLNEGEKGYEVELKDPRPLVGYEHPSGAHCKKLYELPKCKIKII